MILRTTKQNQRQTEALTNEKYAHMQIERSDIKIEKCKWKPDEISSNYVLLNSLTVHNVLLFISK